MKIDKIKVYLIEFILLAILSFALFVPNIFGRITVSILLAVCAIITWLVLKKRNVVSIHSKKVTVLMIFFAIIYLVAFYLMGMYFGYYKALLKFSTWTLLNFIIPTAVIIISSEILRSILLAQKPKFSKTLTFIVMVLVDLVIYTDAYMLDSYKGILEVIGFTFFASVACNLLYNYTVSKYGVIGTIIYRLITTLYMFIIPIIPDVLVFFRSILRMIYPYIIYRIIEGTFGKEEKAEVRDKKKSVVSTLLFVVITIIIALLISGQFLYGILVVATGSMSGTINIGDAIVYEAYNGTQTIRLNDIIIFEKDNKRLVHRVIEVKNVNGELRYTTKGDANQEQDEGYVTNNTLEGICKFRIAYIGYPSLWLHDMLSK